MGVIYFLVYVSKHESNLLTNILTTVGMKTQGCVTHVRSDPPVGHNGNREQSGKK